MRLPQCLFLLAMLAACDAPSQPASSPAPHTGDTPVPAGAGRSPRRTATTAPAPHASPPTFAPAARASSPASAPAQPRLTEQQKIERLIAHVQHLRGAVFIRNDEPHDCAAAAGHMRDKWQWKKREIRTARDFIRVAASRSSTTGRPYLIRFKDGTQLESGEFLLHELARIESTPSSPRAKNNDR